MEAFIIILPLSQYNLNNVERYVKHQIIIFLLCLILFAQIQVATMLGESIVLRSLEQFVDILSTFAEEIKGMYIETSL